MPNPSLVARLLRLQFSLRALLVLMALVGIGLVVFRWPWIVKTQQSFMQTDLLYSLDGPGHDSIERTTTGQWRHVWSSFRGVFSMNDVDDYRITTTYRRGWNGKAQKNGLQQYWRLPNPAVPGQSNKPPILVVEKQYVDDDLRQVTHYSDEGKITFSEGRLNGLPHGQSGGGMYHQGKRVGAWRAGYAFWTGLGYENGEAISVQQSYRDGLLHGKWIWKTNPGDRVLQTARYDNGQLVEWNGLPKEQALEVLLTKCGLTDASYAQLQRPAKNVALSRLQTRDAKFSHWELQIGGQPTGLTISSRPQEFTENWVLLTNRGFAFPSDQAPIEALLEEALSTNETLVVRDGKLFVVMIAAAEVTVTP